MTELPLLVIDVQRGGPSTGLPTKTEQADLLQAMFGRNGEAPVPIVAPQSPGDCFDAAARGRPDRGHLPDPGDAALRRLPRQRLRAVADPRPDPTTSRSIDPAFATERNHVVEGRRTARRGQGAEFWPYLRDEATLARPWAIPGTAGLEHRIGGLEKGDGHGNISYDPANHDFMVRTRQAKIDRIADSLPPVEVDDPTAPRRPGARCWCSAGARRTARSAPAYAGSARPGTPSRRPTCGTSTRSRPTSATCSPATTRSWSRR